MMGPHFHGYPGPDHVTSSAAGCPESFVYSPTPTQTLWMQAVAGLALRGGPSSGPRV